MPKHWAKLLLLISSLSVASCASVGPRVPPPSVCPRPSIPPASLMQKPQVVQKVQDELFEPPPSVKPRL